MSKDTLTQFLAYHHPALESGEYTIEQKVEMLSGYADKRNNQTNKQYFYVASERFMIPPNLVFACYPPKDNEGLYATSLPHIELTRSTLPWERPGNLNQSVNLDDPKKQKTPWLALLIIDEKEFDGTKITLAETSAVSYLDLHKVPKEPDTTNAQTLSILKCEPGFAKSLLPDAVALSSLTHVRVIKEKDEISSAHIPAQRAIIVANRIPRPGASYVAHLVSVEGRYSGNDFKSTLDPEGLVQLISLYNWRFTSAHEENYKLDTFAVSKLQALARSAGKPLRQIIVDRLSTLANQRPNARMLRGEAAFLADLNEANALQAANITDAEKELILQSGQFESATLRSLLNNLNIAPFQLTRQHNPLEDAEITRYLQLGSVPLPHHLRAGGSTVSWYRGPFTAFNATFEAQANTIIQQHADELIQHNIDTGLLDVSYAAAWELGRLLFIAEPKLVQQLQLWKLEYNYDQNLAKQQELVPHLANFMAKSQNTELPESIKAFLLQSWRLTNCPYHYLVPNNALLPAESIRFFKVDELWSRSFMYGVLSLGEAIGADETNAIIDDIIDTEKTDTAELLSLKGYKNPKKPAIHGILLNSEAVSGWPALQIEAYNGNEKVGLWQKSYLSANVLLCLFNGKFDRIALFLPKGDSHFGFDLDKKLKQFVIYQDNKPIEIKVNEMNCVRFNDMPATISGKLSSEIAIDFLYKQEKVLFGLG